jgi:hypothetical protein
MNRRVGGIASIYGSHEVNTEVLIDCFLVAGLIRFWSFFFSCAEASVGGQTSLWILNNFKAMTGIC